jgi:hypothetical protein
MPPMNDRDITRPLLHELLPAATSAWLVYLVLDFLIHAVFLAPYWRATESYWLPPRELFRMIPFAYISFAVYCAGSTWLLVRLYGNHPKVTAGLRFGAGTGCFLGAVSALGNYSVLRIPVSALIVWPVSGAIESTGALAAAAWILTAERPWRRVGWVFGASVLLFAVGVVIQNLLLSSTR